MRNIDAIPSKPPIRRICADFQGEAAVEIDMLEVQIGINRAARNKSERDAVLMEIALLSLRKHIDAFVVQSGDKYPDYRSIAHWLDSGYLHQFSEFLLRDHNKSTPALSSPVVEASHESRQNGE